MYRTSRPRRILRLLLSLYFVSTILACSSLTILSTIHYHNALAATTAQTPTPMTQKFLVYSDPADGISIQYPSDWKKIEYFQAPIQMSTTGYKVVVNFLAPLVNASDQWREYLMIQVANPNSSLVKSLVPQTKTTLAGNPAYKLVYSNNEETFHLKTLETWTTIGGNIYLLIYKAEASKYSNYLPIIQRMIDSFKVTSPAGSIANSTAANALSSILKR